MTHTAEQEREAVARFLRDIQHKFTARETATVRDTLEFAAVLVQRGEHIKGGENG
jgi:hypothetical protein